MFFDKKNTSNPLEMVRLKNGSEVPKATVITTMINLGNLRNSMPGILALYDLTELCKNPDYDVSFTKDTLLSLALVSQKSTEKITVHDDVKNILLSAVEGEGMNIDLCSPIDPANLSPRI